MQHAGAWGVSARSYSRGSRRKGPHPLQSPAAKLPITLLSAFSEKPEAMDASTHPTSGSGRQCRRASAARTAAGLQGRKSSIPCGLPPHRCHLEKNATQTAAAWWRLTTTPCTVRSTTQLEVGCNASRGGLQRWTYLAVLRGRPRPFRHDARQRRAEDRLVLRIRRTVGVHLWGGVFIAGTLGRMQPRWPAAMGRRLTVEYMR